MAFSRKLWKFFETFTYPQLPLHSRPIGLPQASNTGQASWTFGGGVIAKATVSSQGRPLASSRTFCSPGRASG